MAGTLGSRRDEQASPAINAPRPVIDGASIRRRIRANGVPVTRQMMTMLTAAVRKAKSTMFTSVRPRTCVVGSASRSR